MTYSFPITEDRYNAWIPQAPAYEPNVLLDGAPSRVLPHPTCSRHRCTNGAREGKTGKDGTVAWSCGEH